MRRARWGVRIVPLLAAALLFALPAASLAADPPSYQARFGTSTLAGGPGAVNQLSINAKPTEIFDDLSGKIAWPGAADRQGRRGCSEPKDRFDISAPAKHPDITDWSAVAIRLPSPPCWWPIYQDAVVTIRGKIGADRAHAPELELFKGTVSVLVFWLPLLVTLLAVGLIYPGAAMASWYAKWLKARKAGARPPRFLISLDPVDLTRNAYGRASVAKLQIFLFTLIVFALLLFHVLRSGNIANMSTDVLLLLGISAFGAAGGKLVHSFRRRLKFENWAWLQRHNWLPEKTDVRENDHAKWSELLLDPDTKEFDPYSFQMIVFSAIVAAALIGGGVGGLETFKIPQELLALLGISQIVFIGGRAIDKTGYDELDTQLDKLQKDEKAYIEMQARLKELKSASASDDEVKKASADLAAAQSALETNTRVSGEMFWALYGEQIGSKTEEFKNAIAYGIPVSKKA